MKPADTGRARPPSEKGGRLPAPEILQWLLEATNASRTTLRLEQIDGSHPVVADALPPGLRSIAGDASINLRDAATFKYLDREHRPLVQGDLAQVDDPPPPELIARYGARSQMLAPIV